MATDVIRLKDKIIAVMDTCAIEETDPETSKILFAQKLAEAIVYELLNVTIVGTAGGNPIVITSVT